MKIAVLLSGGVDSSVALNLLARQGHELHAFYLKIWLEDELAFLGECPWEDDLHYARAVCEALNVPLTIVPLQAEYLDRVVAYALDELRAGRTPSPDVFCNRRIKFGAFFDHIDASFDKVASGHYAQVEERNGQFLLRCSPDRVKDQTYFLSHLRPDQMARACFPLGPYTKAQVREMASEMKLPNSERKDSQGICFLGKIQYRDFVKFHLGEREGKIVDRITGTELGPHQGFWFYTIGQRQGLGLSGGPWFVSGKDTEKNIVYVTHRDHLPEHEEHRFVAGDVNWIAGAAPDSLEGLHVKLRHGPHMIECSELRMRADGALDISLAEREVGIAAGQIAVLYRGDICLGGGVILARVTQAIATESAG